ncbi:unnamed protein product [Prorocentrum cordatum]|uniref:Uncharacterized protein n=1 Tax=Prorocentrum cordatum TaxID=2364126 RepID=A0ABN9PKT4_9DINO|nr:unnamed protein product [Polarella glacialis]
MAMQSSPTGHGWGARLQQGSRPGCSAGGGGDAAAADEYTKVLEARRLSSREQPIQQQIAKAFNVARSVEDRLGRTVSRVKASLDTQRALVGRPQAEYQQADDLHKQLVTQLLSQVVEKLIGEKLAVWSVRSILFGSIEEIPASWGNLVGEAESRLTLSQEDKDAADQLATQLKQALKQATETLF